MRLRNVGTGFWKSEDVAELSHVGRLLFIGLWAMADRRGVLAWRPKRIKAEVFPYDDLRAQDVESIVGQMAGLGMVSLYRDGDGTEWVHVTNFERHQLLSTKEKRSGALAGPLPTEAGCVVLSGTGGNGRKFGAPGCGDGSGTVPGQVRNALNTEYGILNTGVGDARIEGDPLHDEEGYYGLEGSGGGDDAAGVEEGAAGGGLGAGAGDAGAGEAGGGGKAGGGARQASPVRLVDGEFAGIGAGDLERWRRVAPGVDVDQELLRAAAWLVENPRRMKKNLRAFLGNWIRRSGERPEAVARAAGGGVVRAEAPKAWAGYGRKG